MASLLSWIDVDHNKQSHLRNNSSTMQAVRYYGPNVPLKFDSVSKPTAEALGDDDVLVLVKAAALCHTELHFADGTLNLGVQPMTLGHEAVGIVTAVGSAVSSSRVGERVIIYYYVGCQSNDCRWCAEGQEQVCPNLKAEYGFISDGGLAEYIQVPARNAVTLPDKIAFQDAAPVGCGLTTAVHAAKMARMSTDRKETALVYGTYWDGRIDWKLGCWTCLFLKVFCISFHSNK